MRDPIGQGSYGTVYKIISSDGKNVLACKVMNRCSNFFDYSNEEVYKKAAEFQSLCSFICNYIYLKFHK